MPVGAASDVVRNMPPQGSIVNLDLFNSRTQKNVHQIDSFAAPGENLTRNLQLPQSNLATGIRVTFDGTCTVALPTGTATTGPDWPYGLVAKLGLSANWMNDILVGTGLDWHVLRFLRNPAYVEAQDFYPGTVGGGNVLTAAVHSMHLTWFIPIAMDPVSLIGALYLQSAHNAVTLSLTQAPTASTVAGAALITTTLTATAVIAGTFRVTIESYDIPEEQGVPVTPDNSRLHGSNYFDYSYANSGDVPVPLVKVNGQLTRLLIRVKSATNTVVAPRASAIPSGFQGLRLNYGGNKEPQSWPVPDLVAKNNEQFGALPPYGYLVMDNVRESPVRDAILMQGVTDLKVIVNLASTVIPAAGAAVHVFQETLFQ